MEGREGDHLPGLLKAERIVDRARVVVVEVEAGPGRKAGIRKGDVLSSINNQMIESPEDFASLVDELPSNRAVPALIIRNGNPSFIVIKIEE